MGASEKAAATYHPSDGPAVADEVEREALRRYPYPHERSAAVVAVKGMRALQQRDAFTAGVEWALTTRPGQLDAAALLAAMREQMAEAESGIGDPNVPQSIVIATADAFGTVIDWVEDTYIPSVTP